MSASESASSISRVHPSDVTGRNLLLLDVRTPVEYEEMHIQGSTLLPLAELTPEAVALMAAGKEGCVVICRSGGRATQAAEKLRGLNLPNLQILEGGVKAWEKAGRPLQRGAKMISLERQVRIAAGALVFTGTALGVFLHPGWLALPAFVGAGLVFAGITDTCGMGLMLARMPWNQRGASGGSSSCRL